MKTKDPSRSPAIKILELLKSSTLQNYGSKETLREMKETLAIIGLLIGKPEKAKAIYNLIQNHTKRVSPRVKFEDDPKIVEAVSHLDDVKFLNVVYASKARYLISMNTAHLVRLRNKKTLKFNLKRHWFYILTAGEFLKHIREKYRVG
nr:PIN domain-containing protein [Thermococcus aciditolerans]